MWKERDKLYRKWKTSGQMTDKISWKQARAKATRTFKEAKNEEFKKYVSGMTLGTPIKQVYERLRKIRGRPARKISILEKNGKVHSTNQAIVECLAQTFAEVSRSASYSRAFMEHKREEEKNR